MRKKQIILTISLIFAFVSINLQGAFLQQVQAADLESSQSIILANAAPVADPQSLEVFSGYFTPITLTGSDPDGDSLTFIVVADPVNGTLEQDEAPFVVYCSDAGYEGEDSFQFIVSDGVTDSAPVTVHLTVRVNTDPVAYSQEIEARRGVEIPVTLTGFDEDGDVLTFLVVSYPMNGSLFGEAPNLVYRSRPRFEGFDSFFFVVQDAVGESNYAMVTIRVGANASPTANDQQVDASAGYYNPITLTGSDPEDDPLIFIVTEYPLHGTLDDEEAPNVTYLADKDYKGPDSFTFIVSDGANESEPATVSIMVRNNANPVAKSQHVVTRSGVDTPITLEGEDDDGDDLTFVVLNAPMNGSLFGEGPDLMYRSRSSFEGDDSFLFVVQDEVGESEIAIVSISVGSNEPPKADSQDVEVVSGYYYGITLTGSDPEGDALSFYVAELPEHGTLEDEFAPYVVYRSDDGYEGQDSFQFFVSDGGKESALATVFITVSGNANPRAFSQEVVAKQGVDIEITLEGEDDDGDELTFILLNSPMNGSLFGDAPDLTYRSRDTFLGEDSFLFVVSDGIGESEIAVVTITVVENTVIEAQPQQLQEVSGEILEIFLKGSAGNNDDLMFSVTRYPQHGMLNDEGIPYLTYTPRNGFAGTDSFDFVVSDGVDESNPATVTIIVLSGSKRSIFLPLVLFGADD